MDNATLRQIEVVVKKSSRAVRVRSKGKRLSFGVKHPASVSQTTKVNKPGASTLLSSHGGKACRIIVKEKAGVEKECEIC